MKVENFINEFQFYQFYEDEDYHLLYFQHFSMKIRVFMN